MSSQGPLDLLRELGGHPAPLELEQKTTWITGRSARAIGSRGKALGVLFRRVGDGVSAEFLGALGRWTAGRRDVEVATVSFIPDRTTFEAGSERLLAEVGRL